MQRNVRFIFVLVCIAALCLGGGCSRKAKAARHAHRADKYFDAGQYPKAEIEYLNALQLGGQDSRVINRLGTIYYDQGRLSRAFAFLSKAAELSPTNLDLQLKLGQIYLAARKTKETRDAAMRILEKRPEDPEAPALLAESITSRKEAEDVTARLEQLTAQLGETPALVLAGGVLKFRQGDLKGAESAFKRSEEMDPKRSAAHHALGNLYVVKGDLPAADAELKAAAELSPRRSPLRLSYAEFKIRTGELEQGKQLLAQFSKETPDYVPVWVRQAEIALAEKQYTNCASLLTEALARDPDNFEALLLHARLMLAQKQTDKAITELERATQLYQTSGQAWFYLSVAQLANNDVTKAVKSLNRSVALDPNAPEGVLLLAELNVRTGNNSAAIASLKEFVKQRPQIPQARLLLAAAYLGEKNLDDAAAVYQQMITSFPNSPQVPLLLGTVLVQQKKSAEARQAFEESLKRSAGYLPAVEQLVELDLAARQYTGALDRISKELEKQPKAAQLQLLAAKIHMARATDYVKVETERGGATAAKVPVANVPPAAAEANQAEAALLKAIELDPNFRPAYLMLAQVYVASDKHQQALEKLSALASTNDVPALMQVGMIQEALKNYAAARDAYERLLAVNPRFSIALNNLAYLYSDHFHQLDKAYDLAEKARQLLPADPFPADTLGWILCQRGEYTRAIGLLEESARLIPEDPEIQFHLGMTYYMLGDEPAAERALQKAAQAARDFPGKEEAKNRLEILAVTVEKADAATMAELEKRAHASEPDPVALARLAAIDERNGAFQKAAAGYEEILKHNPKNAQMMGKLARLSAGPLNDQQKALDLARQAHALAPDDGAISGLLGRLAYQPGDYKWSLSLMQEAARKLPDDAAVLYDLAWASYGMGRIEDAVAAMDAAIQRGLPPANAEDAKIFAEVARAPLEGPDRWPPAERVQQILANRPNHIPALMASAVIQEQTGHKKEAKLTYEKILAVNPLFAPAGRALALLCARDFKDDSTAYAAAARAREAYPQDPAVAKALGIFVYLRGNDDARAIELLKESAEKNHDEPEVLYYLGMAHLRQKQPKQSKDALRRALDLNLAGKFAADARRALAELN